MRRSAGRMRPSSNTVIALLAAMVCVALAACGGSSDGSSDAGGSSDKTWHLRVATIVPPGGFQGQALQWWADQLKERTDGRVEAEIFFSASLLPGEAIVPGVRDGVVDVGHLANSRHPQDLPLYQAASIPFVTSDANAQVLALNDLYQNNEAFQAEFEKNNLHVLNFTVTPPAAMGLDREINALDDLRGTRLASFGYQDEVVSQSGATPVNAQFADLYESIQRGVIDGFAGQFMEVAVASGLHEVVSVFNDTGLGVYASGGNAMNLDTWNSFPDDIKTIVTEVSDEAWRHGGELLVDLEKKACDSLQQRGTTVHAVPQPVVDEWKARVEAPIAAQFLDNAVKSGLDRAAAQQFLDDYRTAVADAEKAGTGYVNGLRECVAASGN